MNAGKIKSVVVLLVFLLVIGGGAYGVYWHMRQKAEAKKKTGVEVYKCCRGEAKRAGGCEWRWLNE